MEYSKRLGEITDEQLQKALDKFDLGKLVKAEPITFGNFGQNLFLTSNKGEFVLRGRPHYPWQFPSEQFIANLFHDKTQVPVPWPYLVDEKTEIFGWSYCIMPRLNGLQLKDKAIYGSLLDKDKLEVAQALGENLAKMQKLTWDFSGKYDLETRTIQPLEKPWDEWVIDFINDLVAKSVTYSDKTSKEDVVWINRIIESGREALQIPFTPTFVMHDYQISNMVVDKVDGKWLVTGLFDLMENYFGDGESDLSRVFAAYAEEKEELAYVFLNSYLSKTKVRTGFEKRWSIYNDFR
ncbi:MAG: phosphotransferase [Candidatus Shapirobacteria bacterium]